MVRGSVLQKDLTLEQAGITEDCTITVVLEEVNHIVETTASVDYPKPPKDGYRTEPAFDDILRMTEEELKMVNDFAIMNEHGSIQWLAAVDLTGVDLARDVTIEQRQFEVYQGETPPLGQKLNSCAIVRLNHVPPSEGMSVGDKEQRLRRLCQKRGHEFLAYHPEKFYWEFKLLNF